MKLKFSLAVCLGLLIVARQSTSAATFEVGPGKPYAGIGAVPWTTLAAGDTVNIYWRASAYKEKWVINRPGTALAPILVQGIPDVSGQLPVIDGNGATTSTALNYWGENRSVIKIGGANTPNTPTASYITVQNLEVKSARSSYNYVGYAGNLGTYAANASPIRIEVGDHITIRNCIIRDGGNGLLSSPSTTALVVERCYIYGNGNVGSTQEHNIYTESNGIIFQFNRLEPLLAGASGNNLKDRSANTIIRYNWIQGGSRELDLVESDYLYMLPGYTTTFVYGNVLIEPLGDGNSQIVHYGGDGATLSHYRNGPLYFYNNTVVSNRTDTTRLFRVQAGGQSVDCRNNIVHTAGGTLYITDTATGTVNYLNNWLKTGYATAATAAGGAVNNLGGNITGSAPGFVDAAGQNFHLVAGSSCTNNGATLAPAVLPANNVVRQYVKHQQDEPRPISGALDIGAYEIAGALPVPASETCGNFHTMGVVVDVPTGYTPADIGEVRLYELRQGGDRRLQNPVQVGTGNYYAASVFDLTPGTSYSFRADFHNTSGTLVASGSFTGTTRPEPGSLPAPTREIHVATSGHDANPGTALLPKRTIGAAFAVTTLSGTHIVVHGGTYYEGPLTPPSAGTTLSPTVVRAADGEEPVIDGSDQTMFNTGWTDLGGGYYSRAFTGTTWLVAFRNATSGETFRCYPVPTLTELNGKYVGAVANTFAKYNITGAFHCSGTTLTIYCPSFTPGGSIEMRVSVRDTAIEHDLGYNNVIYSGLTFRFFTGKGIYANNCNDIIIRGCKFQYTNVPIGVKRSANRLLVENCQFKDDCARWGFLPKGGDGYGYSGYIETGAVNVYSPYDGRGLVVRNNVIDGLFDGAHVNPDAAAVPTSRTSETDFHNNTVLNAADDFIELDGWSRNVRVFANTMKNCLSGISVAQARHGPTYAIYNDLLNHGSSTAASIDGFVGYPIKTNGGDTYGTNGWIFLYHNTAWTPVSATDAFRVQYARWRQLILGNNIWAGTQDGWDVWQTFLDPVTMAGDLVYQQSGPLLRVNYGDLYPTTADVAASAPASFKFLANAVNQNPQLASPATGNLMLLPGSPASDAGSIIPGINDEKYLGAAPDIGAHEGVTATPPAAPSILTATAISSSAINLNWTDNSDNESGFRIERADSATGTWSEIATVSANTGTYSNTGLAASTTYYYQVLALNAAGTSSYTNTASATTFPPPLPDLVFHKATMNKATFTPGEIGSVSVTVKNLGSGSTGGGFNVKLFRNAGTTVNCATSYSAISNRATLAGGGATDAFTLLYTNPPFEGLFVLRLFVDGSCSITEASESGLQQVVRYYAVSNGPCDLVLNGVALNKASYGAGELSTATVTVTNTGTGGTLGKYNVGLYLNLPTLAGCGTTTYKTINRASLSGGTSVTFPITFVTALTNGAFTMRAFADNTCALAELTEANNQATASYSVVVSPPDLTIDSLLLNKASYSPGERGSATVTIRNAGGTSTGVSFSVKLYRHAPTDVTCTSPYDSVVLRPKLLSGATATFAIPFTAPTIATNYVLRILVDGGCAVAETPESNNQATTGYDVVSAAAPLTNDGTPTVP
jgi:hypothetical protein